VIRVAVPGAAGKMGRMVIEALAERAGEARLGAALERPGHASLGQPVPGAPDVTVSADVAAALGTVDAYIDFTAPAASVALAQAAAAQARGGGRRVAAVVGTTGLGAAERAALDEATKVIPVVWAPNFSLGVNLLAGLVEQAARALGEAFDIEIVEFHHKAKRDAPSGTAILLGEAAARGRDWSYAEVKRHARDGDVGARPAQEIGVVAVRGGDVIGDHHVHLLGPNERIELTHRAGSRMIFARGAVRAALFAAGKPPGLYSMQDVLGLRDGV
jgi:4-hydroxy-tetrahydrodipicolinate reductase